jgi:hypothetical protein
MTKGDRIVERGSERLRDLSEKAAAKGGVAEKLAPPLAEDAAFLRKLKPSLIAARARGEAPTNLEPGAEAIAPTGPQLGERRKRKKGPNPFVVVGAALALGVTLAKLIDWRGHAHPRG